MELATPVEDKEPRCETEHNPTGVSTVNTNNGINKPDQRDNSLNSDMKEGYISATGDRSVRVNMDHRSKEDNPPCVDMSLDNSKDDSDFSDYSEDNNRCQLANQALRAKLLNGVFNPITGIDSKLRVSVFDHRIIPKKLIIARKNDNQVCVDTRDNLNENKSHTGANVNELNNSNKRKGPNLSYPVFKASRKSSIDCDEKGEPIPKMESESEYRTRFDILLRNLIGDVSEMAVEPSPMTVSSGYESDYIQTRESDIDKMFNTNTLSGTENKENIPKPVRPAETKSGYFCMGGTVADFPPSAQLTDNHQFTSLPSIPTQQTEKIKLKSYEEKEISKHQKQDKDSGGFSYTQRHNYKLTKVTRSMYEIIHDLQNGDKVGPDGRKRSKKGRKSTTDGGNSCSDGSNSAKENKSSANIQLDNRTNVKVGPEIETGSMSRTKDTSALSVSGSVVRCVRRPAANDSSFLPTQRRQSYNESNRLLSSSSTSDCDKVQNDLRNLLCDTSDVTLSSADNHERVSDFNMFASGWPRPNGLHSAVNGHSDTVFNQADIPITCNTATGQRRPTLNEQFLNRHKPDDHVYETIPGDEKLYEEWKKMQANPKIPKIRRYTTVPDLPGTFIPREPPALPARKYLNNNTGTSQNKTHKHTKDTDDYIFMGDINSNFPTQDHSGALNKIQHGNMLDARLVQCFPYTLHDDHVFSQPARNDETSDGYCSIDNISLCRDHVIDKSPEQTPRDWRPSLPNTLPPPPLKRSDFFLRPCDRKTSGFNLSSSHLLTERPAQSERRSPHASESEPSFTAKNTLERDAAKPVIQATYV